MTPNHEPQDELKGRTFKFTQPDQSLEIDIQHGDIVVLKSGRQLKYDGTQMLDHPSFVKEVWRQHYKAEE